MMSRKKGRTKRTAAILLTVAASLGWIVHYGSADPAGHFYSSPLAPTGDSTSVVAHRTLATKSYTLNAAHAGNRKLVTIHSSSVVSPNASQQPPSGNVLAWGDNSFGELGNGTITANLTPALVNNLSNAVAIADGCCDEEFSIALRSDGTIWAWG